MTRPLLDCPFCGGIPSLYLDEGLWNACCCIGNGGCGNEGWREPTKDAAIAKWNRRAPSLNDIADKLDRPLAPPQVRHAKDLLTRS